MDICYLCRTFYFYAGGIESYTFHMAKSLSRLGHTVHIITEESHEKRFNLEDLGERVYIHTIHSNREPFPGAWRLNRAIPIGHMTYARQVVHKIEEINSKYKIDIIEAPDLYAQSFFYAKIRDKAIPLVVRLHGGQCLSYGANVGSYFSLEKIKKTFFWHMEKATTHRADHISSVSQSFADIAQKNWELRSRYIQVIYNGIDTEQFKPCFEKQSSMDILYVGRLEAGKGIGVWAQAMPEIVRQFPNARFVFAGRDTKIVNGDGTWMEHILKLVAKENVVFLGEITREELKGHYQKSGICVFPSLFEAFGIVLIEAMASGCACVASRVGGFVEIITDRTDGLLVEKEDPQVLAQAVIGLLKNESLRKSISANAEKKVKQKFSIEKAAERMIKYYEDIVSGQKNTQSGITFKSNK